MKQAIHALVLASLIPVCGAAASPAPAPSSGDGCAVTAPNGVLAGSNAPVRGAYGNAYVSTAGLWPEGTIVFKPGGPGFVEPDGGLTMKFFWQKAGPEPLRVTGRRLDRDAPPLHFAPGQAEGHPEWVPSYVTFSAPGCWEITARLDGRPETTLTFVTRVVKVGAGPGRAPAGR